MTNDDARTRLIGELIGQLRELDHPPTGLEIAEALWLAESMSGAKAAGPEGAAGRGPASKARSAASPSGAAAPSAPRTRTRSPAGQEPGSRLFFRAADLESPEEGGVPISVPTVPALSGTRAIFRALRPLSRRFPSTAKSELDEEETVAGIADFGLWSPRFRPLMDRWLDLTLVVDTSTSMALWRQSTLEFRTAMDRLGAFRDVRTWRFDGDRGSAELSLRGESDVARHLPAELRTPVGRRVVLVISDCMGAAWSSGAVARALEDWSKTAPVAVLQPLPERLWSRSGQTFIPVALEAARSAPPNAALTVRQRGADALPADAGTAIPVLELSADARWLASWADLIGGTGRATGVALFCGLMMARSSGHDLAVAEDDLMTPVERVLRFREKASPTAYSLAGLLAAAPLSLQVMRLVQGVMLPRSRPAHLAEVVLSDLVRQTPGSGPSSEAAYDFRDGVRDQLLAGLPRGETVRVLEEVGRFLCSRPGETPEFPAIIDAGAEGILAVGQHFARVAFTALQAVGGHYADIAAKLEPHLDLVPPATPDAAATARPADEADAAGPTPAIAGPDDEGRSSSPEPESAGTTPAESGDVVTEPISASGTTHKRRGLPRGWSTVPRRNPNFTGRSELLLKLRNQLSSSITALVPHALYGLGGVGKTQLAIEYVYQFATEYDLIWWISAEEEEEIASSLAKLATELGLGPRERMSDSVANVLAELGKTELNSRWLLVYDNAGDPDKLLRYLPPAVGDILITSLNQEWNRAAQTIAVDIFTRDESIELIQRRGQGISRKDADLLAERLGDLPLAIEQAATWQRETGMRVVEYLEQLDKQHQKLLTAASKAGSTKPVAEAWGVAFDRLVDDAPDAAQLLQLCAFFGPEPISIQILHFCKSVPGIPPELHAAAEDGIGLHTAIRQIGRYGLAQVEPGERLRVHRLVQAVLRDRIPPEEQDRHRRLVHQVLAAANPGDPDNNVNWPTLEQIGQHVVRATGLIEGEGDDVRHVVLDQIRYRYARGDFERSRELAKTTTDIWKSYGDDDRLLLIAYRHMGNALRGLGRYQEALEIDETTYERMKKALGDANEHTLMTASSYAADLRIAGDYSKALELDRDALALHSARFGNDARNTLRCQNNLAVDLRLQGDFREALQIDKDIYEKRSRELGQDDQDTLFARCMIARDLRGCGLYREALELFREVLPDVTELLGDHEDVLNTRLSYGLTLSRNGDYEAARQEIQDVLHRYRRKVGETHPGSMRAMTMLASPLRLLDNKGGAYDVAHRAAKLAEDLYGTGHIFTMLYQNNRAITLRGIQRFEDAYQLDEDLLPKISDILGPVHPFTLSSTANLATSLSCLGRHDEARERSQIAYDKSVLSRGEDNPLTLACACNLAFDMIATGDDQAGQERADASIRRLGEVIDNPDSRVVADLQGHQRYEFDIEPPRV